MRPLGTAAELERRRRRAVELFEKGESPTLIARILGVQRGSVYRWARLAAQGPEGLSAVRNPGPTPRLDDGQLHALECLLCQGARAHGWPNDLWTAARVALVIRRHFGVTYHPDHVRRFLRTRLHWTSQKPQRKARERDEDDIARWQRDEFPRIVRQAWARGAHLVFLDESGYQLTPSVRRTLAPRGRTPVLDAWDRRDRLSAISCITVSPRRHRLNLYFQLLAKNANVHGDDVVAYLAEHPEIVAEDFPGYTPELNPDEHVWGWTKYGRLANLAAMNTDALWDAVVEQLIELKYRPRLLNSFIKKTKLPLRL